MRYLWILCFTTLMVVLSHAQYYDLLQMYKRDPETKKKFCGRQLTNQLSLVCKGRYNRIWNEKKSGNNDVMAIDGFGGSDEDYWEWSDMDDAEAMLGEGLPWLPRRFAAALRGPYRGHKGPRRRRGITDECCDKPCSHNELKEYCDN